MSATHQNGPQGNTETQNRAAEAAKASINLGAAQGRKVADTVGEGVKTVGDLHEQTADRTIQMVQSGVQAASKHAQEASDRVMNTIGFTGKDSERLATQSKQNMEAVTQCGTVLTQAFQDSTRGWFELSQRQWKRNLEGLTRLAGSKSVEEFAAVQTDLIRDGFEHMVADSRALTERSLRAFDRASKAFAPATS